VARYAGSNPSRSFDKRLAVFNAYRDALLLAYYDSKIPDDAWIAMKRADITAPFLFEADALQVLERSQKWINTYASHSHGDDEDAETRRNLRETKWEAGENANVMLGRLKHAFQRYLAFTKPSD